MKPKFAYLYGAFISSLVILVTLSFLFYQRLKSHLRYSEQLDSSYQVILHLKDLEKQVIGLETFSRGYLLIKDSSLLSSYQNGQDSIPVLLEELKKLLVDDRDQLSRLMLMRSTIMNQMNIYSRTIQRFHDTDTTTLKRDMSRGKMLMDTFRLELSQIQTAELKQRVRLFENKKFFENIYPNFFNTVLLFAGVITLVSFFFINREVRIRAKYQSQLEKKLHELNRSNAELEQFAYVASHDLQEPLRKIRMFSDRLIYKHKDTLTSGARAVIDRMDASAQRLQELIQDMVNFTRLINRDDKLVMIDLNEVINNVLFDFKEQIEARGAIIQSDELPFLSGNSAQLLLLFKSLFDNAFKFSKQGEPPVIHIGYRQIGAIGANEEHRPGKKLYHKIIVQDNGIGFDNEFADRIFMIFQRLHTQQSGYRGKGIGLAIAQRIMINHNGIIMAKGMVNDGATFIMYFPVG